MKAVNLLPDADRPRVAAKAPANASIAVLVVLALLLVGVAGWVFTKNQVNDKRTAIATATQEKAEADAQAQGLQAFGDFSQIKQTRVQAVTDLATKRFDWERFMRELALVLPDKVWVSDVTAAEAAADGSTASPAPAPPSGATQAQGAAGAGASSVAIKGCAPSQKSVAATIVRLRTLYAAQEVDLKDSASGGQGAGGTTGAPTSDGASSTTGCGRSFEFNATVKFVPPASSGKSKAVRTPSRLGGGA